MSIPDFQTLLLPVLRIAADGEVRISDVVEKMADEYVLSQEDRSHLLPSGKQRLLPTGSIGPRAILAKLGWWN